MFDRLKGVGSLILLGLCIILGDGPQAIAQDAAWHIGKSSGEVWLTGSGVQQVSPNGDTILKPGDMIRTGRNGRVLLVRGEETILISPNSVIGIPAEPKAGLSTTIIQQAGSIILEVEKRNVKHFEVETPYFAAVVKGTQFQVSVNRNDANVDVTRGQVEVADFKSGQYALVLPGQVAKVLSRGVGGLFLSGSGTLSPILKGEPRAPSVKLVPVPKEGLSAPPDVPRGQQIRMVTAMGTAEPLPASVPGGFSASRSGISNPARAEAPPASVPLAPVPKDGVPERHEEHMPASRQAALWPASPEDNAPKLNGWSPDFLAWGNGGFNQTDRRANRNADIVFDLAFSLAVGACVAVVVAISRRRRRRAPA